ncbi:MAG: hypothetical protein PHQ74_13195 [Crocinitomicaceae bacterium]|nr:hypothetical protein [Crocinitomicaceae bacterium]
MRWYILIWTYVIVEIKKGKGLYKMTIAEGSNMVRIGTAIFGNHVLGKEIWNENETE